MGALAYRMLGALSLDSSTFGALEADRTATRQAFLVVLLSSVAAGIGARYLPERETAVSAPELLRTVGFAATPGLFQVFGFFPTVTVPVFVGTWLWMLAAMVVAVRQALDYSSTARAVLVCATALVLILAVAVILPVTIGPTVS